MASKGDVRRLGNDVLTNYEIMIDAERCILVTTETTTGMLYGVAPNQPPFPDYYRNPQWLVPSHDQDEHIAELENAIRELIKYTMGCTCPNNGGGDCPWCEAVELAKELL